MVASEQHVKHQYRIHETAKHPQWTPVPVWLWHQRTVTWEAGLSCCCSRITQGRFWLGHYRTLSGIARRLPEIPVCEARQTYSNCLSTCTAQRFNAAGRAKRTCLSVHRGLYVINRSASSLWSIGPQAQLILLFFKSTKRHMTMSANVDLRKNTADSSRFIFGCHVTRIFRRPNITSSVKSVSPRVLHNRMWFNKIKKERENTVKRSLVCSEFATICVSNKRFGGKS